MLAILDALLLKIHIVFGTLSLVLFWIPVFAKKGVNLHVKVGRVYYYSMWVVVGTAVLLCIINFFDSNWVMGVFLGYLSIVTAYPLWYSWEILHQKRGISQRYYDNRRYFNIALALVGVAMCILGIFFLKHGVGILMIFFGVISLPAVFEIKKTMVEVGKKPPIIEHITGTIISGIAAYTAFFAFGGSRLFGNLFSGPFQTIPWMIPTVIGLITIRIMKKKYQPRK